MGDRSKVDPKEVPGPAVPSFGSAEMAKAGREAQVAAVALVASQEAWARYLPRGTLLSRWLGIPISLRVARLKLVEGRGSPLGAIKAFCYECQGYDRKAAEACDTRACPLWWHRPGAKKGEQGE